MGLFEKRRARKFFIYVQDYDESDPKSHEGLDLSKVTAKQLITWASLVPFSIFCYTSLRQFYFDWKKVFLFILLIWHFRKYGLEDDTIDFIGHALALHFDDSYLDEPALDFVKRMKVKLRCACFTFYSSTFVCAYVSNLIKENWKFCTASLWLAVCFQRYWQWLHIALRRIFGTFPRRISLHLSTLWTWRVASGMLRTLNL